MQKRVVSILLGVTLAMAPMSVMAATSDEIQTEIDAAQEELSQAKDEADETLDSQEELQEEVNDINSEIDEVNAEIEDLGNISIRDAISDVGLEIIHSIKSIFNSDSENQYQTTREQIEENQDQLEQLQTDLASVSDQFDETTQAAADLEMKQSDLADQLDDLQEEYDTAFAEEEAARKAEEEEAARKAEEEEAAQIAEEEGEQAELEEEATHVDGDGTAAQTEADSSSEGNPPVEAATSDSYEMPSDPNALTWSKGVNNFNGHTETWYTKRVWKGELGIPGMYIGKDGIIRDCDNYICVASDDYPRGTVIETSLGTGKVYDSGSGHGNIDIYTDWPLY